ncbi:MAG: LptA/OstA family protein [Alphaproteobacteria bacterium]
MTPESPKPFRRSLGDRFRGAAGPVAAGLVLGAFFAAAPALAAADKAKGAEPASIPIQSDKPIEIYAHEGIEWDQNSETYIARGNARAVQGDVTIYGSVLTAKYRKTADGGSEIWRLDADGKVRIESPKGTVYGEKAIYDMDTSILVVTGNNLKLVTPKETVTARDSLEYWQLKDMFVARGDALAVLEDRKIKADILTAHLRKDKNEESKVYRVDAFGSVLITTPTEIARGEKGVYFVDTGIATLTGAVKITRGDNQLNGEIAEINMNTGVSRILAGAGKGGESKPVRALIVPAKKSAKKPAANSKKRSENIKN